MRSTRSSISYTLEAACAGYATQSLNVKILVDGAVVMATDLPTNDPGSTDTATLTPAESSVSNLLFEPGAPTQHTLSATFTNSCGAASIPAIQINSVRLDVVGTR